MLRRHKAWVCVYVSAVLTYCAAVHLAVQYTALHSRDLDHWLFELKTGTPVLVFFGAFWIDSRTDRRTSKTHDLSCWVGRIKQSLCLQVIVCLCICSAGSWDFVVGIISTSSNRVFVIADVAVSSRIFSLHSINVPAFCYTSYIRVSLSIAGLLLLPVFVQMSPI